MKAPVSIALMASFVLVLSGCSGFGRKFNQALPEFLRSDPGADEIERYQTRVRVLNRSEEDERLANEAFAEVKAVYDAESWNDAADDIEDFLKDFPDTKDDKEARWLLVQSHRNDDEADECARAINAFIDRYPISDYNDRVEDTAFELATEMINGEHDGLLYSEEDTGIALFEKLVVSFPRGRHAATSFWRVGNFYFDEGRFAEAEGAYASIIENYPESEWAGRAQFNRGLSLYRAIKGVDYDQRVKTRSIEEFENYLAKYPEGDRQEEAQSYIKDVRNQLCEREVNIGAWYEGQGFPRAARYHYLRGLTLYPDTETAQGLDERIAALPADSLEPVFFEDGPASRPVTPDAAKDAADTASDKAEKMAEKAEDAVDEGRTATSLPTSGSGS